MVKHWGIVHLNWDTRAHTWAMKYKNNLQFGTHTAHTIFMDTLKTLSNIRLLFWDAHR